MADAFDLAAWRNDEETVRYLGGGFSKEFTLDDAYELIELLTEGDVTGETFVIEDAETRAYLGECSLMLPDMKAKKAELSIVLTKSARGKGYAPDALRRLISHAFNEAGYERLYLKCAEDNTKALRLYERAGFITEGRLRNDIFAAGRVQDVIVMGLLRDEYTEGCE